MAVLDLANIAAMTALTKASLTNNQQVIVGGYTSIGDGGGGTFYWEQGSSTSTDGGTVFAADEGGTGRWKRIAAGPTYIEWFGVKGDASTNNYTALNNAFTYARNSSQRAVYAHAGTFCLNQQLNISNVSLIGEGAVATVFKPLQPFTGDSVLLIDDTTGGSGGVDSLYQNFRILGNRSALSTTVHGLKLHGNVLYNQFSNIRFNEVKGVGILLEGKAGPVRPTLATWINVHVSDGDSHGVEIRAGRNMDWINCAFENLSGTGINITSATETAARITFHNPWIENVSGHGIYANDSGELVLINPNIGGYGSTGVASYGIAFTGSNSVHNTLIGGDFSKNAFPHASSRHIFMDAGYGYTLQHLPSTVGTSELSVSGDRGLTIHGAWQSDAQSKMQFHFSNGRAAISAGQTRYLAPNTGGQSSTQTDVRQFVTGYMHLIGLRFESTVNAGGSATFTVTVFKNGSATAMTATTAAGGGTGADSHEVILSPGDNWSVKVSSSAGAASIPQDGLHIVVGARM